MSNTDLGKLKPGNFVMVEGEPCKVIDIAKSKPGKHGSAKARVEVIGIFDGKKREIMKPADATIEVPIIEKKNAQVVSVSGDIVQIMDLDSYETFELSIPEELKGRIEPGKEVVYWKVGNKSMIKDLR
jgi:translation initiation factor 5A